MNNEVGQMINQAVKNIIEHTGDTKTIKKLIKKHDKKIHFIPKRYRVLSGTINEYPIWELYRGTNGGYHTTRRKIRDN